MGVLAQATIRPSVLRSQLSCANGRDRTTALVLIAKHDLRDLLPDVRERFEREIDPAVKSKCAWVLGHLRDRSAYGLLRARLEDSRLAEDVRVWCAWAIGEIATTRSEAYLRGLLGRTRSPRVRSAIGGALKKVSLDSVRAPARQLARRLQPPRSENPRVMSIVARLGDLQPPAPATLPQIVDLRRQLKEVDERYFSSYMDWLKQKPIIERALENPRAVYQN